MIIAVLILLGLCFGSFINAFVWRYHELENTKSRKRRQELSIAQGRSMCVHCGHTLEAIDLLPVISWVSLKGKCRYCRKPISWQYPLVELLTTGLFVASYIAWPYGFDAAGLVLFGGWLALLIGLVALAVYDFKWMLLPTKIVYALSAFWVFVLSIYLIISDPSWEQVGLYIVSAFCVGGLFFILHQVSKGEWIGGGDVRIGYVLGLLAATPAKSFLLIFISSLLGTIVAIPYLIRGQRKAHIPFGPFLIAAAIIVFLIGDKLIDLLLQPLVV